MHPGRPQDLGGGADAPRPQRGRPVRPAADLRRLCSSSCSRKSIIPAGANKVRVPAGAAGHLRAGLRRLGGDPVQRRLGDRRHQCRHPLPLRDLLARRLRRHHGGLGVELEIPVPGGAALGGADGVLRGLDRLRHHHRAAVRRLAQPVDIVEAQQTAASCWHVFAHWNWFCCRCSRCW